ncbi:MAG: hypothetical protein ACN6I4_00070 [bacterium]
MNQQFEKVSQEYLEIEPLDFEGTQVFYNKYKIYLDKEVSSQIQSYEEYRSILASIGTVYFINKQLDIAIPLLKKAIKLGSNDNTLKQNLIISYFSKKKYFKAYYYYLRFEPKSNIEEFSTAMKVAKQATVYNLFVWFLFSGIAFYIISMSYEFFYDDIEGSWDNVVRSIYGIAVIVFALKYYLRK